VPACYALRAGYKLASNDMTLNRRHKAILFVTLVLAGCALLVGAELRETLGFLMLGTALAWAVGSHTAVKLYSGVKGFSGTFYSWVRLPLFTALAGALLAAVLIVSRANPVIVVVVMCAAGIFIHPLTTIPTRKIWLRVPLILLAGITFFLGLAALLSVDLISSNQYGERFGQLAVTGFIALLVGVWWLSKGWRLIVQGIGAQPAVEITSLEGPTRRAWGQYISLAFGLVVLVLWLGVLSWSASSNWAYAADKPIAEKDNNLLIQVAFIVLLARWPYRSWKIILDRERNSESKYLRRHRRTASLAGILFVVAVSLAVTYGVQNGNDRIMVEKIRGAAKDLTAVGTKIGVIKQRDLRTTADYIQAYSEIEPLLPEFESEIQRNVDVNQEARRTDERRGPVNIQAFYKSHKPDLWKNDYEMLDLVRQVDSLTRQETQAIRNMSALPVNEQVAFWQKEFKAADSARRRTARKDSNPGS
jgi:hypothetical protein